MISITINKSQADQQLAQPLVIYTFLLFSKKIIAIPTGMAMGFAIPHAIKQQK